MSLIKEKSVNFFKNHYLLILFSVFLFVIPGFVRFSYHYFHKSIFSNLTNYIHFVDLIILTCFIYFFYKKRKISSLFKEDICLIVFLLIARLSLLYSEGNNHHKAYYDIVKLYLAAFSFYFFQTIYFEKNKKILIDFFIKLIITIAVFTSLLAIFQFIKQGSIGFDFLNETAFGKNMGNTDTIASANDDMGVLKYLIKNVKDNSLIRSKGLFFHSNMLGGFLLISSLLTMFLIEKTKTKKYKFLLFFFLTIELMAMITSFCRSAIIGFVLASFIFFILMINEKHRVLNLLFFYLLSLIICTLVFMPQLKERGLLFSKTQSHAAKNMSDGSDKIRKNLKEVSINMIEKRPIKGVGFRNFIIKKDDYIDRHIERANVHNIYLLIFSEVGIFGLLSFVLLIFFVLKDVIKYKLDPLQITIISIFIVYLIIGLKDHYPIASQMGRFVIFLSLGYLNYQNKVNKHLLENPIKDLYS
jgi:O-antigen ligase